MQNNLQFSAYEMTNDPTSKSISQAMGKQELLYIAGGSATCHADKLQMHIPGLSKSTSRITPTDILHTCEMTCAKLLIAALCEQQKIENTTDVHQ